MLEGILHQARAIAAFGLDGLELGPGGLRHLLAQRLDKPGAANRIGNLAEIGLFHGDDLRVAGHAPAKFVRHTQRFVERAHGDDIGSANRRAEAGAGAAQHVHPGIIARQHARGSDSLEQHGLALNAERFQTARPEPACRAQLGGLHAIIGVHGQREQHLPGGKLRRHAERVEPAQRIHAVSDERAEFLCARTASLMHRTGIHAQAGREREAQGERFGEARAAAEGIVQTVLDLAGALQRAERIDIEGELLGFRFSLAFGPDGQQGSRTCTGPAAMVEGDGGDAGIHAFKRGGQPFGAGDGDAGLAGAVELQLDGADAAFQVAQDFGIRCRRIGMGEGLADIPGQPGIALRRRAAQERRSAGLAERIGRGREICLAVKRADIRIAGARLYERVRTLALQGLFNSGQPIGFAGSFKFARQRENVVGHMVFPSIWAE